MKIHPLIRRWYRGLLAFLALSSVWLSPSAVQAQILNSGGDPNGFEVNTGDFTADIFLSDATTLTTQVITSSISPPLGAPGPGSAVYNNATTLDGGVIVGETAVTADTFHAFRFDVTSSTMTDLGTLGTGNNSFAQFVSTDGEVVVGSSDTIPAIDEVGGLSHAFRWTEADGILDLGTLGTGSTSSPTAMTPDGSVIVGQADVNPNDSHAFRWTLTTSTMTDLGTLGTGSNSFAQFVSTDGEVVVGSSETIPHDNVHAFRWTQAEGMVDLGTLGTGTFSTPNAMTPDGSVIVGEADTLPGSDSHAFRWKAGTMTDLGTLGAGTRSSASFVSTDGNVVVGNSDTLPNDQTQAFRWTPTTGMVNLNNRGSTATFSFAGAMNHTGSVVVGTLQDSEGFHAFRWTEATGMQTVEEWLTDSGVTVGASFVTGAAYSVSEDGTVVTGSLQENEDIVYLARGGTGIPGAAITVAELRRGMVSTANSLSLATDAGWTMLSGAHGHPLARRAAEGKSTAWAAGDLGEDSHGSRDGDLSVGEVGVGHNFGRLQFNLALGKTNATQHTPVAGKTELNGTYLMADLLTKLPNRALWVTLSGFYQLNLLDIRRGYLNAGTPDSSSASFDAHTAGGALRADWENAIAWRGLALTPYVKGTVAQTTTPTFTETGGGFPAVIAGRKDLASEVVVGVNSAYAVRTGLRLVGTIEGVHRFQGTSASTTADFGIGIGPVTTPGQRQRQDWARGMVGIEHDTSRGLFSISVNATTTGQAANLWLATSFQINF